MQDPPSPERGVHQSLAGRRSRSIFFSAFWHYGRLHVLRPDADAKEVSGITRSYLPGMPLYLTGTLIALASPVASVSFYAAIAVFYAISNTFFGKEPAD